MKRIMVSAMVEDKEVDELVKKLRELIKEVDIQVSNAPPQGAGATLAGVA